MFPLVHTCLLYWFLSFFIICIHAFQIMEEMVKETCQVLLQENKKELDLYYRVQESKNQTVNYLISSQALFLSCQLTKYSKLNLIIWVWILNLLKFFKYLKLYSWFILLHINSSEIWNCICFTWLNKSLILYLSTYICFVLEFEQLYFFAVHYSSLPKSNHNSLPEAMPFLFLKQNDMMYAFGFVNLTKNLYTFAVGHKILVLL